MPNPFTASKAWFWAIAACWAADWADLAKVLAESERSKAAWAYSLAWATAVDACWAADWAAVAD